MKQGLIGGKSLFADSTHLKANANKKKYDVESLKVSPGAYVEQLNDAVIQDREASGKKPLKCKPEKVCTKDTKVSRTDPDSGFMVRDEKPKGFFYLDHRIVDGKHNIIVDTHTTPGNVHDSQPIISRIDRTMNQFSLNPEAVGLDAGYFTAPVCHELEKRQLIGVMGYRRPTRKKGFMPRRLYGYNPQTDTYTCPEGQELIYKTTSREGYRQYHSDANLCRDCPKRDQCTQSKNMTKVVTRHVWQASVEKANETRLSDWGKKQYKRRSETVERSFADAKQHHGHRYCRYRGMPKVKMQCLLAAACQNMKKMALMKAA
jgi:IS5 family transposase